MKTMTKLVLTVGLLGAWSLSGCLIGGNSRMQRDGTYVSDETLRKIEPGKTDRAWILATLGNPSEKNEFEPGRELWKYSYKETSENSGHVFLLISGDDRKVIKQTVFVELKDGVVTKSWRG